MADFNTETISINGVEYVRKDSNHFGPVQIIVGDKGFVFVGNVQDNSDGSVTITEAKNIRQWGTTKGLGELTSGPTEATVTDFYGTVRLTPIVRINVVSGW